MSHLGHHGSQRACTVHRSLIGLLLPQLPRRTRPVLAFYCLRLVGGGFRAIWMSHLDESFGSKGASSAAACHSAKRRVNIFGNGFPSFLPPLDPTQARCMRSCSRWRWIRSGAAPGRVRGGGGGGLRSTERTEVNLWTGKQRDSGVPVGG